MKNGAQFRPAPKAAPSTRRPAAAGGADWPPGLGHKKNVQVRPVIDLAPAQFAQADDAKGSAFDTGSRAAKSSSAYCRQASARHDNSSKLCSKSAKSQNVAQADAHQFGLMVAAQPQALVGVSRPVAQIGQRFLGAFGRGSGARWLPIHPPGPASRMARSARNSERSKSSRSNSNKEGFCVHIS